MRLFESKQEAINYVNDFYNLSYNLSVGESSKPLLVIRKANKHNKWKIRVIHQYHDEATNKKKDFFV